MKIKSRTSFTFSLVALFCLFPAAVHAGGPDFASVVQGLQQKGEKLAPKSDAVTGKPNVPTEMSMKSFTKTMRIGATGEQVKNLQE